MGLARLCVSIPWLSVDYTIHIICFIFILLFIWYQIFIFWLERPVVAMYDSESSVQWSGSLGTSQQLNISRDIPRDPDHVWVMDQLVWGPYRANQSRTSKCRRLSRRGQSVWWKMRPGTGVQTVDVFKLFALRRQVRVSASAKPVAKQLVLTWSLTILWTRRICSEPQLVSSKKSKDMLLTSWGSELVMACCQAQGQTWNVKSKLGPEIGFVMGWLCLLRLGKGQGKVRWWLGGQVNVRECQVKYRWSTGEV